jgi:hypothetical protein
MRILSFVTPSPPSSSFAAVAAAAASSPPSLALTFSGLKYCCASMSESNDFSQERVSTTPMKTSTAKRHKENETINIAQSERVSSGRSTGSLSKSYSIKRSTLLSVEKEQENLMQRRNIDALSPISVKPESFTYGNFGLVGVTYIKSKSSSSTTPIESDPFHSKSSLELSQESSSSSVGVSRKVVASRNGDIPTASIEAKQGVKFPLAKHDRYDAAIEAYRRRRHRVSSLLECKQKVNNPSSSTSLNVQVAATVAESEGGRPSQVQAKEETNGNASVKKSSSNSFPHRAGQRRAEVIEMQKRKSRSVVLSRATSESSKIDTLENIKLQLVDRTGRLVTRHNEVATHVCNDNDGASISCPHRTPPRIQADRSSTMRRNQMQQTVTSISNRSTRSRSLSVPRSMNSCSAIADKVTGGRIECAALSSNQSNNGNLSLTNSCSFSGRGEECQQILSRVEIRKARARQGRHRMVSGG